MKNRILENRQQLKLFIKDLIGFAALFAALGVLVYFLFQHSVYSNIDVNLYRQKERIENNRPLGPLKVASHPNGMGSYGHGDFQTSIIVFNRRGIILNKGMLGQRNYKLLSRLSLDPSKINKPEEVTLSTSGYDTTFRSLLLKVSRQNDNPEYAGNYVLILQNIDADLMALHSFVEALTITLFCFWIIAILIAYYLSKSSMKPIINAWHRQTEFSANASHELRTPLTVIQNQMEFLLTKPTDRIVDQIQPVSTTLEEVKHLKVLTQRLLMLARSDSNLVQANRQVIELAPLFNNAVLPFNEIAKSQHKLFTSDVNVTGTGNIDADLIRQLMVILIDNAIKYTPEKGQVHVLVTRDHNAINIQVADTGGGIADADKRNIFERFYRTDKSRNSKTGGTGLGLSIAQWIVKQHHGTIYVQDGHPTGSIFKVHLTI
jgi:two-component system, OmpR family, sensor histidine kinase CiaH